MKYEAAKEEDASILHQLGYWDQRIRLFTHLYRNCGLIATIAAHHLGLTSADICHVVDVEDWIHGSFNVCIRIDIDGQGQDAGGQVMIRVPLPYRIGSTAHAMRMRRFVVTLGPTHGSKKAIRLFVFHVYLEAFLPFCVSCGCYAAEALVPGYIL
jgi:hypothetical protein